MLGLPFQSFLWIIITWPSWKTFRLKVFRTVAEHLNFRKAAEHLFLTQPAVTLQIKALEDDPFLELVSVQAVPRFRSLLIEIYRIYRVAREPMATIVRKWRARPSLATVGGVAYDRHHPI
jgi:DNA-binding transcriptional ArsR family regulator